MARTCVSRCSAHSMQARTPARCEKWSAWSAEPRIWALEKSLARAQIGSVRAQSDWATALAWVHLPPAGSPPGDPAGVLAAAAAAVTAEPRDCSPDTLLLAVGGADGAVRLLGGLVGELGAMPPRLWYEGAWTGPLCADAHSTSLAQTHCAAPALWWAAWAGAMDGAVCMP